MLCPLCSLPCADTGKAAHPGEAVAQASAQGLQGASDLGPQQGRVQRRRRGLLQAARREAALAKASTVTEPRRRLPLEARRIWPGRRRRLLLLPWPLRAAKWRCTGRCAVPGQQVHQPGGRGRHGEDDGCTQDGHLHERHGRQRVQRDRQPVPPARRGRSPPQRCLPRVAASGAASRSLEPNSDGCSGLLVVWQPRETAGAGRALPEGRALCVRHGLADVVGHHLSAQHVGRAPQADHRVNRRACASRLCMLGSQQMWGQRAGALACSGRADLGEHGDPALPPQRHSASDGPSLLVLGSFPGRQRGAHQRRAPGRAQPVPGRTWSPACATRSGSASGHPACISGRPARDRVLSCRGQRCAQAASTALHSSGSTTGRTHGAHRGRGRTMG